eukprot:g74363.t1
MFTFSSSLSTCMTNCVHETVLDHGCIFFFAKREQKRIMSLAMERNPAQCPDLDEMDFDLEGEFAKFFSQGHSGASPSTNQAKRQKVVDTPSNKVAHLKVSYSREPSEVLSPQASPYFSRANRLRQEPVAPRKQSTRAYSRNVEQPISCANSLDFTQRGFLVMPGHATPVARSTRNPASSVANTPVAFPFPSREVHVHPPPPPAKTQYDRSVESGGGASESARPSKKARAPAYGCSRSLGFGGASVKNIASASPLARAAKDRRAEPCLRSCVVKRSISFSSTPHLPKPVWPE